MVPDRGRVISPGPCGLRALSSGLQGRAYSTPTMRCGPTKRGLAPHPAGRGPFARGAAPQPGSPRGAAAQETRRGGRGPCRRPVPGAEDGRPARRPAEVLVGPRPAGGAAVGRTDGPTPDSGCSGAPRARAPHPARPRRSPRARSGSARRPPPSAAPGWGAACAPSPGCPCPSGASRCCAGPWLPPRAPRSAGPVPRARPSLQRGVMASAGRGRGDAGTGAGGCPGGGGGEQRGPGTRGGGEPGALGRQGLGARGRLGTTSTEMAGGRFGMAGGRDRVGPEDWSARGNRTGAGGHAGGTGTR